MRRVEAAEDPFADLPGVGLFGVAAQGRDAAVADGGHRTRPPHSALEGPGAGVIPPDESHYARFLSR